MNQRGWRNKLINAVAAGAATLSRQIYLLFGSPWVCISVKDLLVVFPDPGLVYFFLQTIRFDDDNNWLHSFYEPKGDGCNNSKMMKGMREIYIFSGLKSANANARSLGLLSFMGFFCSYFFGFHVTIIQEQPYIRKNIFIFRIRANNAKEKSESQINSKTSWE